VTYALIGDSQGVGVASSLASLLPVVFSEPHSGWTTARLVRDGPLERALASGADKLIVVTGGNDDPLSRAAFGELVSRARAARVELLVVGPVFARTDDAARHDAARAQLEAAARDAGVRFLDAYPLTRDLASTANVHLTATRYRTYAERIASAVRGAGAIVGVALALGLGWLLLRGR